MQVLVIGAGVVGLAIARTAALAGHDVTVAETTGGIANGVSSRNSEVIHAGLYYPTGTLRAIHCVRGRRMLYEFCASHGVPHRKCGKLVVATNEAELAKVETILAQAQTNGVEGVEMIGGNAARAMEAELSCIGALWSPETGIIDSHAYMRSLWGEFEDRGGMIAFQTPVERMSFRAAHWHVQFGGRDAGVVQFDAVVNAAGLGAQSAGAPHRRLSGRESAAARARQRQLFRLRRAAGVLAAHLSDADRRRAWRACHARPCRAHAVRAGRRVDRARKLRRRSAPRRKLLRPHPHLLAGPAGRFAGAGLCRDPAEALAGRAKARPTS